VDGDNLLGAWPGRDRSDSEKRELAREIGGWAAADRRRIVLVFDGTSPVPALGGGADVRFAGGGRSADDLILALLRRETDPAGWTVVTNDRSLADRSRHAGARVERCDVFRKNLAARPAPEKPDRGDIDYWLDLFGKDER
jgi:hypothetical protein